MELFGDLAKWVIGGLIVITVYSLLLDILVGLPGCFVLSLFVRSEYDPDNRIEIDPTGWKSYVVGILLWAAVIGIGYALYQAAK